MLNKLTRVIAVIMVLIFMVFPISYSSSQVMASSDETNKDSAENTDNTKNKNKEEEDEDTDEGLVMTDKNDLFFEALERNVEDKYNVMTVQKGTIKKQETLNASVYCPTAEMVTVPVSYGTVQFEEMLVKIGDKVKKGTPIAKITTIVDDVAQQEQTLALNRLQNAYDSYVKTQSALLKEQKKALDAITDKQDKKIAKLEYEKAKLSYDLGKESQKRQINSLKEAIADSKKIQNITEVVANVDGYVASTAAKAAGDKFDYTTTLATIVEPSKVLFTCKLKDTIFHNNLNVTLEINPTEEGSERTITGKVVSSVVISREWEDSSATCYIKPDEDISYEEVFGKTISATVDICTLEDVLVVPKDAVSILSADNEADFTSDMGTVYKLINGALVKQSIIPGLVDSKYYQVLAGLEEGTQIVKKQ